MTMGMPTMGFFHVYDVSTGMTTNLKLGSGGYPGPQIAENLLLIAVNEGTTDLNDDEDTNDEVVHVYDASTGITTNLKLAGRNLKVAGNLVVIPVEEKAQGMDLNDDGDRRFENVVHVYDASTGMVTNLKLAGFASEVAGNLVFIHVNEREQKIDLNDDGDRHDSVLHVYDAGSGVTTNLKLAGPVRELAGNLFLIHVNEATDLNDDGDKEDSVLHVYDASMGVMTNLKLAANFYDVAVTGNLVFISVSETSQGNTDLNDDGDADDNASVVDGVVHVYDASTGVTTNLKLAGRFSDVVGNLVFISVDEEAQGNTDLNEDGDADDDRGLGGILHVYNDDTGLTTNLRLAGGISDVVGNLVLINVDESRQGNIDLNEDGDAADEVIHIYDVNMGVTTNLTLAGFVDEVIGNSVIIGVREFDQGNTDLNNDGDTKDSVLHVIRLDETGPAFDNVSDITQEATGPGGAIVDYPLPKVTDDTDLTPSVTCAPASGSFFALGITKVTCMATDVDGNEAVTAFTVRVVSEIDAPLRFTPIADATIKLDSPTENFGAVTEVKTSISPVDDFLMKFDVSGIGTRHIQSAKLRLFCTNKSDQGGEFHLVGNDWSEDIVTWDNAPPEDPEVIASLGPVVSLTWVEVDLTSLITEDGVYSLRVMSPSQDGADYRSREKAGLAPELVITLTDSLTFTPTADATIKFNAPTENFGASQEVETDDRPLEDFLMKFNISGIGTSTVTSAILRLFCNSSSDKGGDFHLTEDDWLEDTVTWDNAPLADREVIASLGPVVRRTWVEVDLTSLITEDGVYSFRVMSSSKDGADYRSKEKPGLVPELTLTLE